MDQMEDVALIPTNGRVEDREREKETRGMVETPVQPLQTTKRIFSVLSECLAPWMMREYEYGESDSNIFRCRGVGRISKIRYCFPQKQSAVLVSKKAFVEHLKSAWCLFFLWLHSGQNYSCFHGHKLCTFC